MPELLLLVPSLNNSVELHGGALKSTRSEEEECVPLENRFYRRYEQYSHLEYTLSPTELGMPCRRCALRRPIARIPESGWGLSYALAVYTLSGRIIERVEQLRDRTVPPFGAIAVGWSTADLLSVVYSDSVVFRIPSGLHLAESRIVEVQSSWKHPIYNAVIFNTGQVVLRASNGAIYLTDSSDKVCRTTIS